MNEYYKTLQGNFNKAIIYRKHLEKECEDRIYAFLNSPLSRNLDVRIMPDVHLGKETVIGFTSTLNDYIIPGIIGVDIGCGVSAWNLGKTNIKYDKLDNFIRKHIPSGKEVRDGVYENLESVYGQLDAVKDYTGFKQELRKICERTSAPVPHVMKGIGSLGGGNHFIELDRDDDKNTWLVVHSGSRYFGYVLAMYYKEKAGHTTPVESPLKYLAGADKEAYLQDLITAQSYASLNRAVIGAIILGEIAKKSGDFPDKLDCPHNYVSAKDNIIRKGAVSAHQGESIIIPFSMAEGAVMGVGKGNQDWNYSVPHGAGRKMSRVKARQSLDLDYFRKKMRGVWTSCISKNTLEESPMAYKKAEEILSLLEPVIQITARLKPVYNFKAPD